MYPKPEPRRRVKGRKQRRETAVKLAVRAAVVARDCYCRISRADGFGACDGPAEWAHLEEKKRSRTKGMAPEQRHRTDRTLMFCRRHHHLYDHGIIHVEFLSSHGADGRMGFTHLKTAAVYREHTVEIGATVETENRGGIRPSA